jgi:hypothetical protein
MNFFTVVQWSSYYTGDVSVNLLWKSADIYAENVKYYYMQTIYKHTFLFKV